MSQYSDDITAGELFKGFFSKRKWVNLWYKPKGLKTARLYILEFGYPYENNPHGDQVIWCLYSRKNLKTIERFITSLKDFMQSVDKKIVIVHDPNILESNLFLRISFLSDGHVTGYYGLQRFNDPLENKVINASIGIAIGQNRRIVLGQDVWLVIAIILGHVLSVAGVHDDFTDFGARLLDHARKAYLRSVRRSE